MQKLILVCAVFSAFSIAAGAQEYSKVEVFGGYSFVHSSVNTGTNFNGGSGSISFNPNAKLGVVADFGVYRGSTIDQVTRFTYLFGPKVAMRSKTFTPFAHALFGGAHERVDFSGPLPPGIPASASENSFAMALGGGLDAKVHNKIAIRLFQVEYMLTTFKVGTDNRQNGARISTGIVFGFGG